MKKDVTTFTRYLVILFIAFILWLFLLHKFRKEDGFRALFGIKNNTMCIQYIYR